VLQGNLTLHGMTAHEQPLAWAKTTMLQQQTLVPSLMLQLQHNKHAAT